MVGVEVSEAVKVVEPSVGVDTGVDDGDSLSLAFGEVPDGARIDQRVELLGAHVVCQIGGGNRGDAGGRLGNSHVDGPTGEQ